MQVDEYKDTKTQNITTNASVPGDSQRRVVDLAIRF